MRYGFQQTEFRFALLISTVHAAQHFFTRLIPPLIPVLAVAMALPLWQLGLLITMFSLSKGLFQAPVGIISDRYDRRLTLSGGIGILAFGYVLFGISPLLAAPLPPLDLLGYTFAPEYLVMCAAMFVSGIGGSVVHPTGYPMITANVSEDVKGKTLGIWGSAAKFGDAASPALIGVLLIVLVWNEIVLLLGIGGVVYAIGLFVALGWDSIETLPANHDESTQTEETADADENTEDDDGSEDDAGDVWSVDRRLFVYPILALLFFFVARVVATQGVNAFVPALVVEVYGVELFGFEPESVANFFFTALLISAGVSQLIMGELTDRYDHRMILIVLLSASAVALGAVSLLALPPIVLLGTLIFLGAGLWGLNPARDSLVSEITPPEREGRTFGYLWTATYVLGAFTPAIIGYIADVTSVQASFRYLALASLLGALFIALLYSDRVYVRPEQSQSLQAEREPTDD